MPESGQAALKGFELQSVVTLLDGIVLSDWTAVTVEPTSEEGENLTKVDIKWELVDGGQRHDQVKYRSSTIGETKAAAWAKALVEGSLARQYRLVLVGTFATGLANDQPLHGATVECRHPDAQILNDAISARFQRWCGSRGIHIAQDAVSSLAERLVALCLYRSTKGYRWEREALFDEMAALGMSAPRPPLIVDERLNLSIRTIMCVADDCDIVQYTLFIISNKSDEAVDFSATPQAARLTVTDATLCEVVCITDGIEGEPEWKQGWTHDRSRFECAMFLRGTLGPGEFRHAGMQLLRRGTAVQLGSRMFLNDPYNVTAQSQDTTIAVVLPYPCVLDGNANERTSRLALWRFNSYQQKAPISLSWRRASQPLQVHVTEDRHARLFVVRDTTTLKMDPPDHLRLTEEFPANIEQAIEELRSLLAEGDEGV